MKHHIKTKAHRIDRKNKDLYKRTIGIYFFKPCSCGCTKTYGMGLQLFWFGISFHLNNKGETS